MIYTIILSNSTVTDNDAGTVASWTVRGESIPIDGRVTLIESMSIHLAPTSAGAQAHSKAIIINIPWLSTSSHSCSTGYNDHTGADAPTLAAEKSRTANVGVILATPITTNSVCHEKEVYESSHTQIPSTYQVSVTTLNGVPYRNLSTLVLKFHVDRSGNF